jgi:hypothetical protein
MDDMADGEAMRFLTWIMEQMGKNNNFLDQENPQKEEKAQS